jgi:hypothetical protein
LTFLLRFRPSEASKSQLPGYCQKTGYRLLKKITAIIKITFKVAPEYEPFQDGASSFDNFLKQGGFLRQLIHNSNIPLKHQTCPY